MVEVKFLVELVIIIVSLAVALYWFFTNYQDVTGQFFNWLSGATPLITGG